MKVSVDWIKEFVALDTLSKEEIESRFTLATAEVEEVLTSGAHLKKITVAEIVTIEKHPEADKLNLVTFKVNEDKTFRVVCGASNVKISMKVPYAPLGTVFPNGLKLEPKKIRGVISEGMLCSQAELGLQDSSNGLMELPKDTKLGINMLEYLDEVEDLIIDIDNKSLTHRPDLWGQYGIAREFSAIYNKELKNPFSEKWLESFKKYFTKDMSPVVPKVEKGCSCIGYYGLSLKNVEVKEGPTWMKRRLLAVGLRPINNIVDISNYVMIELGIPLHIFDGDLIIGNPLVIREMGKNAEFVTLDEEKRALIPCDTVICDSEKPLVLGGIMGGLNSGVTEKTKNIFIEVANWDPCRVRKTSARLGLRTDSSQRYEKSLDTTLLLRTMYRTLELVLKLSPEAKVVGKLEYDGIDLSSIKEVSIKTSYKKICAVLGKDIDDKDIDRIFNSLDFKIKQINKDEFEVSVPSYRATKDIEFEEDLIEEIGRIVGYDNIDEISPALSIEPVRLSDANQMHRKIEDFLVLKGNAFQVMRYPMIGETLLKKSSWDTDVLHLINSISKEQSCMRPSLIPGLLEAVVTNQKHLEEFKFFELGRIYEDDKKDFSKEKTHLGIVSFSKRNNCFIDLVNTTQKLMDYLGIQTVFEERGKFKSDIFLGESWEGIHPYEYLNMKIMGKMNGVVTSIHPYLLRKFKIKGNLSIAIVDLSTFESKRVKDKIKYKTLSKFPSSTFDWTVVAPNVTQVKNILSALKKVKIKEMVSCDVVDIFKYNDTENTITLRAVFLDPEKTLSGEFIDSSKERLIKVLDDAGFSLKM